MPCPLPSLLAALTLAGSALGQPQPSQSPPAAPTSPTSQPREKSPQTDPALNDPSLEDELENRRHAHTPPPPLKPNPAKPPQSALPSVPAPVMDAPGLSGDPKLPIRRVYPEGTFFSVRAGKLIRARSGEIVFVPGSAGEDAPPDAPVVLLECQRLGQIESALASPGFTGDVTLSGQVFVYRGRSYLMPGAFAVRAAPQDQAVGPPQPEQSNPAAEDLIKDLESQATRPRALEPAKGDAAAKPEHVVPEGTLMTMRRGRLLRQPDGRMAFAFDNDPNSPAPAPMTLLPCAQLAQLEAVAAGRGENLAYRISGRVVTNQGRNWLLPTMHQVLAPSDVTPMQ